MLCVRTDRPGTFRICFWGGLGHPCSCSRRETQNSESLGAEESGTGCLGSEHPGSPQGWGTDWLLSDLRHVFSLGAPSPSSGAWQGYRVCLMGGVEDVAIGSWTKEPPEM